MSFKTKHRPLILAGLIAAIFLFVCPFTRAMAETEMGLLGGNIHVGQVRLHPLFSVKGIYTDNFFLEHTQEKENWTIVYIPGIVVQVPFYQKRHLFQFDYRAEIFRNIDFSEYDKENHRASILFKFKSPRDTDINIRDEFILSSTSPEFEGDTLDKYYYNEASFEIKYDPKKRYKLRLFYRNVLKGFYEYSELDDYRRNDLVFDFYYRILPKTYIMAEYTFFFIDNNDSPRTFLIVPPHLPPYSTTPISYHIGSASTDNINNHIWVGLAWAPGARFKGEIKGGYINREYVEYGRDESSFGMRADVTYFLNNFTTIRLDATREIIATELTAEDSFYGTHLFRTGGELSLTYKFPFLSHGHRKFKATGRAFYYNDEYREEGIYGKMRRDDRYGFGAEISGEFWDRLGFKVMYRFTDNDSNFSWEDFQGNFFYGQISLVL